MYVVLDIEFYHNKKKDILGPVKQLGAFKFDENYRVVDIFEMTVTQYTTQTMLKKLFSAFVADVDTVYVWAKNNDIRALNEVLEKDLHEYNIIDVQEYFKDINLASLSLISEALHFEPEGRHNALVDAEYTFEIIKHFNFNNEATRTAITNYVNLIKASTNPEKKQTSEKTVAKPVSKKNKKQNTKIIIPGTMRKLNDEYYQIVNEKAVTQIIESIKANKLSISKDGKFDLNTELEALVESDSSIIFSSTPKFKSIAKKYEDKIIVIVDGNSKNNYLGVFVSKKAYKQFIK